MGLTGMHAVGSKDIDELFWSVGRAHRPEACSNTPCHNHAIVVCHVFHEMDFIFWECKNSKLVGFENDCGKYLD